MLATGHLCSRRVGLIPSPSRVKCKYESDKLEGLVSRAEIGRLLSNTQMTRRALALPDDFRRWSGVKELCRSTPFERTKAPSSSHPTPITH